MVHAEALVYQHFACDTAARLARPTNSKKAIGGILIAARFASVLTLVGALATLVYGCSAQPGVLPTKDAASDAKATDAASPPKDSEPVLQDATPTDAAKDAKQDGPAVVTCLDATSMLTLSSSVTDPKAKQGVCTSTQVSGFSAACLGTTATQAGCDAFINSNLLCSACIQGSSQLPKNPVAAIYPVSSKSVTANIVGCGYVVVGKPECALSAINYNMCFRSVCSACTSTESAACQTKAAAAECAGLAPSKTCTDAYAAAQAQIDATCGGPDFTSGYSKVANYMCGS